MMAQPRGSIQCPSRGTDQSPTYGETRSFVAKEPLDETIGGA